MKDKLINVIRELVNEELANVTELARPSQKYKIADKAKADKLVNLYSKSGAFKWVGDMVGIIEKAGDSGILIADLIDSLYKEFKYNKTSQELNPILSRFVEDGITSVGGLSFEPKAKPEPGGAKGRPTSEKTLIAKDVDQKLQADNNYQPNESELAALGAEFIEKLRARVMGTLKRGRPSDPSKAKDGMVKDLKGLMNLGDKDFDGELDALDDDFEDEDFLQENKITNKIKKQSINEEFRRMQKLAGLINENVSNDVEKYLEHNFDVYLEGGDTFEEEPGEIHTFTMEHDEFGNPEFYDDADMFKKAVEQLKDSPFVLHDSEYGYGDITFKSDGVDINVSFVIPELG